MDLPSQQYGLFPFDPFPFTYLVTSFELARRSLNSHSVELREDVQVFLRNAGACYPQVSDNPDFLALQEWLVVDSVCAEGQSPHISEAEVISDGETTPSEMTPEGEALLTSEELGNKIESVFDTIRSQYFCDAEYKKQVTYPAFLHQGPLVDNFPPAKQAVIPQAIRDDWEEVKNCLAYGQYRAGSMMAFRSVEGMLRYYYWNVTGSKAEYEIEIGKGDFKEKRIFKWGWEKVVSTLKTKNVTAAGSSIILDAQRIRNELAHGDSADKPLTSKMAQTNLEIALSAIHVLVDSLCNQRKALRVCVNCNLTFDTALALWLFERYCWGVVSCEYLSDDIRIDDWFSYTIGVGGEYSDTSAGSASQKVFQHLMEWKLIHADVEIRKISLLVGCAKSKVDYPDLDPESNNIHSLTKWIKQQKQTQATQYEEILKWIGVMFTEGIQIDVAQQVADLRRRIRSEMS